MATTPVIEELKVQEASMNLAADMNLAGVPVTVTGQYNIHSNCFYPSIIRPELRVVADEVTLADTRNYDLESFCRIMDWDYSDTRDLIQEAVEKRDQ